LVGNAEYTTSINIHNPNLFNTDKAISFLKQAVRTLPEGDTLIEPSAFKQDSLVNDYAEYVGCGVIRGLLGSAAPAAPAFIQGFVVIVVPPASSPNQLDVVGVYTASNNKAAGLQPTSLQIVPIAPRIITPPPAGDLQYLRDTLRGKCGIPPCRRMISRRGVGGPQCIEPLLFRCRQNPRSGPEGNRRGALLFLINLGLSRRARLWLLVAA